MNKTYKVFILFFLLGASHYISFNDLHLSEADEKQRDDAIAFAERTMEF